MYIGTEKSEEIYQLIKKFQFRKVIRIASWILDFLKIETGKRNCQVHRKDMKIKSKIILNKTRARKS